jgi:hypothetical protein
MREQPLPASAMLARNQAARIRRAALASSAATAQASASIK